MPPFQVLKRKEEGLLRPQEEEVVVVVDLTCLQVEEVVVHLYLEEIEELGVEGVVEAGCFVEKVEDCLPHQPPLDLS